MSRTRRFNASDLARACAQVKRHILNEVKKGRITKLNKLYVLSKIAAQSNIGLSGPRVLQDKNFVYKEQLEVWYNKLLSEVRELLTKDKESKIPTTDDLVQENQLLRMKIVEKDNIIRSLKGRLDAVTLELHQFYKLSTKYGKIDTALNEVLATDYL